MNKATVLLVCSDVTWRRDLRLLCESDALEIFDYEDRGLATERAIKLGRAAVIFASSKTPAAWEDVYAAGKMRQSGCHHPLILVVGESSEELAVAALRNGINDLFYRSQNLRTLQEALKHLLKLDETACDDATHSIVGTSQQIQQLRIYLTKVALTDSNVLITGETGTGKELVADLLHRNSPRRDKKFIPVNCAAIPDTLVESELFGHERGAFTGAHSAQPGKFQLANGGTVFLDEIGDMDLGGQAKLLRVLESREVYTLGSRAGVRLNVRVVAATNQDPEQLVQERRFRKDLYFRLNVARIHLCPLRERREDIPALVKHAIQELNQRFNPKIEDCSEETYAMFLRYDWPGNVRELKNLLEATFIGLNSSIIVPDDLPPSFHRRLSSLKTAPVAERDRMISALSATNWNVSKAAAALQWSRMTMYRKIAKYNVSRENDVPFIQKAV